jgi:sulfotransferase
MRGKASVCYAEINSKPYIVDKSRGWGVHFDLLQMIFNKDPKIICMVRDLRQVVSSMEKKFRQNPERHRSIENHSNLNGITTYKRVVHYLQSQPIGLAIERLVEIHQRGWSKKILFVRYEDMTVDPEKSLKRIYTYLELPYFQHNFQKVSQITKEDDEAFGIPDLHNIRSVVAPQKADFMEILGRDALRYIYEKYAWYFKMFGYAMPEKQAKAPTPALASV